MDWFRKKTWSKDDEEHFFQKLSRARKYNQSQYLKIQAIELVSTKNPKLLHAAEKLLKKMLTDFPEDTVNRSSAFHTLGEINVLKDKKEEALKYFKKSVDYEKEPNIRTIRTNSYIDYAELIVKMRKEEHFEEVENLIYDNMKELSFPYHKYIVYSLLSFLNSYKGLTDGAEKYYKLAELNVSVKTSGFRYHKDLGLVKKRDEVLDKIVRKEKDRAHKNHNSLLQKIKSKLPL